ncbi:MAG: hypothetical protein KBA51_04330 [Kiritimatiellae bacterium]|nr:hypothetical protein [Kiritimatiellia bacterium]
MIASLPIRWMIAGLAFASAARAAVITVPMAPEPSQSPEKFKIMLPIDAGDRIHCPMSVAPDGKPLILIREGAHAVSVDRNRNGRRDEDEPWIHTTAGGEIRVDVWMGGKGVPHVFTVEGAMVDDSVRLSPGTCLAGTYEGQPVRIFDANINGIYGELGCDFLQVGGVETSLLPMSRLVMISGQWMHVEFDATGPALNLSPSEVDMVEIRVAVAPCTSPETGPTGGAAILRNPTADVHVFVTADSPVHVPPGEYQMELSRLERSAGDGRMVGFQGPGGSARLNLTASTTIVLGESPRLRVDTVDHGNGDVELSNPRIECARGDSYAPRAIGLSFQEASAVQMRVVRRYPDGREEGLGAFVPG